MNTVNEVTDRFLRMVGVYTEDLKKRGGRLFWIIIIVVMKLLLNYICNSPQNIPLCILFRATNKMHYKILYGKQAFS